MKHEGFTKEERVRKSEEFTRILQQGKRVPGRFLRAFWTLPESSSPGHPNRVGIAAGKRLGGAVLRNRLKRRIREAYRRNKRELPCRGIAIIFVATSRMIQRTAPEVEEEMRRLLHGIASASVRSESSAGSSSRP